MSILEWQFDGAPWAVLDIETTGLIPGSDRIIEISVVHLEPHDDADGTVRLYHGELDFISRVIQLSHPFGLFLLTLKLPLAPAGILLKLPLASSGVPFSSTIGRAYRPESTFPPHSYYPLHFRFPLRVIRRFSAVAY